MSKAAVSPIAERAEQIFLVSRPPFYGRRHDARNAPAILCAEPRGDGVDGLLARRWLTHDAALADAAAPHLELRLDERDEPGAGRGEGKRGQKRLRQRDEAHVSDYGSDRLG